ncbi:MAG TPA: NAD-dependent epimerase/dehydratase family protein, partial [Candidatus Bathyarchaeia archaeon]|nr:NAD-dependent epimerase/dehydratase family protein [Candidatus Bathyarchaeia archaeon]
MSSKKPKILVTGATGQIGSELVLELRKKYGGENVVAVGHSRKPSDKLFSGGPYESIDVSDKTSIEKAVKK